MLFTEQKPISNPGVTQLVLVALEKNTMFLAALLARKSRRGHRARSACCPKCSSIAAVYQRYGISESLRARQGRCVKKVRAKSWPHLLGNGCAGALNG